MTDQAPDLNHAMCEVLLIADLRRTLRSLAESWANDAGMSLAWQDEALVVLTDPDATRRALWRCALQLDHALVASAGRKSADLLLNLALQPVEQNAKGPGG